MYKYIQIIPIKLRQSVLVEFENKKLGGGGDKTNLYVNFISIFSPLVLTITLRWFPRSEPLSVLALFWLFRSMLLRELRVVWSLNEVLWVLLPKLDDLDVRLLWLSLSFAADAFLRLLSHVSDGSLWFSKVGQTKGSSDEWLDLDAWPNLWGLVTTSGVLK